MELWISTQKWLKRLWDQPTSNDILMCVCQFSMWHFEGPGRKRIAQSRTPKGRNPRNERSRSIGKMAMVLMSILWDGARDSWFWNCQIVIGHFRYLHTYHRKTSTLHCRGKNSRSKKIGQTNQTMIHFAPNMYVSRKISALRSRTQNVRNFGTLKKEENCLKQRDFRICGFLCVCFCVFFFGVLRVCSLIVWGAANIF